MSGEVYNFENIYKRDVPGNAECINYPLKTSHWLLQSINVNLYINVEVIIYMVLIVVEKLHCNYIFAKVNRS